MMGWIVRFILLIGVLTLVFAVLWAVNLAVERRRLKREAEERLTASPEFAAGGLAADEIDEMIDGEVDKHMTGYRIGLRRRLFLWVYGAPVLFVGLLIWLAEFT